MNFVVGQRWSSVSEPQLGLGLVVESEGRRVTISFPAVEEQRTYSAESAPLSRMLYSPGDSIKNHEEDNFTVIESTELRGILLYLCNDENGAEVQLPELELNCFIQLTAPNQRFKAGQLDRLNEYQLRIDTLINLNKLQQSPIKGLMGSRTSLLPHQVYIAQEVAKRHAPRVLLADEVGLGKTIEAGMILHHQIHTGQAQRVLILVPESLVHQWLVEMLRRFQITFSVFDIERIREAMEDGNPFESEQRILTHISLFESNEEATRLALETEWDLVIVDEAHHLEWQQDSVSSAYKFVDKLSQKSKGLLLLTATPEQVGIEGHFARLRLLDPARFHNLDNFIEEQHSYTQLNDTVQTLVVQEKLTAETAKNVSRWLGDSTPEVGTDADTIIGDLLDRHGTGRVLFRNTREAIQGFPKRCLNSYKMTSPPGYQGIEGKLALCPENILGNESWITEDPRVSWLIDFLKSLKREKALVICHHAETALALDKHLNLRSGIRSTSFYEGLTLIERDRAAAYFADIDGGAQTLICSEIGSEGRNFQFAHHLVLFDLPENPDLLEQRIGRLDRIGQSEDIQIHVPYFENTAQEVLFRWMNEGIGIFDQSCSAGHMIFNQFERPLEALINQGNTAGLDHLIKDTSQFTAETIAELHQGRDALLERNSCRKDIANALITSIEQEENSEQLKSYMESVFDSFGLDTEEHSQHAVIITPGDHMRFQHFPGLREDGNTLTFDRKQALSREDMDFLTWEHPMVQESMEMVINSELGNATLATLPIKALPPATLLLELWFTVETQASHALQLGQFLPLQPFRLLLNISGKDLSKAVSYEQLNGLSQSVGKQKRVPIIAQIRPSIETMYQDGVVQANSRLDDIKSQGEKLASQQIGAEIERLKALRQVNPNIRDEEIIHLVDKLGYSLAAISRAEIVCQGMRVLITKH